MTDQDSLFDAIYASALQPNMWPAALEKISKFLESVDASITPDYNQAQLIGSSSRLDVIGEYSSTWRGMDIIRSAVTATVGAGETYCDWKMISKETIDTDPFYQDFRRKHGVRHLVGRVSGYQSQRNMRFAVQLPVDGPPKSAAFLTRFDLVANHVCRAFALSSLSDPSADVRRTFGDVIARLRHAVAIVDHDAKVIFANASFESLAPDGLQIVDGLLRTASARDQRAFDRLVRDAISIGQIDLGSPFVFVARPSRRQPLLVRAVPLSRRDRQSAIADGLPGGMALVFVAETDSEATEGLGRVLQVRGLTAGEARIAALIGTGLSPIEGSIKLGLTEGTVRTRIKAIFQKLGISRQSELARLVTQIDLLS